ncbi:MAG: response regulator [Candidatus Competibacter sp.]|nr:response regulator [Candidatus Competibacter sp.]MDG4584215.1 response regulator [Candidatus Competibacter sp.]
MNRPSQIERLFAWLAGGLAVFVMLAAPTAFFLWSYQNRSGALQSEAQSLATVVTEFVNHSTGLWRFQPERLTSLLQRHGNRQYGSAVIGQDGTMIAHLMPELAAPTLIRAYPIYDFGTEVGSVEVVVSLRGLAVETAWVAFAGLVLGVILFFPLRLVPLRALRKTTQALADSENAYRQLVELSPDMIFINLDEKIAYINASGVRMFGADSAAALLGASIWDRIHPDSHAVVRERIKQILALNTAVPLLEERYLRMDGAVFPVEVAAAPFVYRGKRAFQVVAHDLSARKRAEAALHQAKEAAEAASRAKSAFLATMSHEIRTPLNGVLGMAELLRNTPLNAQQQRFADMILNSGHALLVTINDILDFSKIESGRMTLEVVSFDLRKLVEETAALLAGRAHEKSLDLVSDLPLNLPAAVRGDPIRLRQILVNLASNAIKFTERGEVVMRLRLLEQNAGGPRLCFEVQDTGIGIAPAACAQIFDAFTQADGSTTRHYGGTGLGLAIVRQLIQLMGGEIGVDSTPEVGSRFWFTLPLLQSATSVRSRWPAREELRGLRILLVDDNATNREILQRQTMAWGLVSDQAENGVQALARLRDATRVGEHYDLALLDVRMPGMDGLDLAGKIRADPTLAGLKLVLLSSNGLDARTEQTAQADIQGVQGVLYKPVRQADLYKILCRLLIPAVDPNSQPPALPTMRLPRFVGRILVVEDNPVNQEMALTILNMLGCQGEVAANGQEAVEAVARAAYDLILMDCQMPVLDGFAATAAIRRWEHAQGRPRLPIVALTANIVKGFREQCLAEGMDDYLSKPFTQEQLAAMLDRWLPASGGASMSARSSPSPVSSLPPTACAEVTVACPEDAPPLDPTFWSSSEQTVSPLDEQALAQIRALQRPGQPSVLVKIIELYLNGSPVLLQQMREAAIAGDGAALCQAAHGFKSSSANLGAAQLVAVCKELEYRGRDRCLEDVPTLLRKVDRHYARVRAALVVEMERERRMNSTPASP